MSDDGSGKRVVYAGGNTTGIAYLLGSTNTDDGSNVNGYYITPKIGDQTIIASMDEINILTDSVAATPVFNWREDFTTTWTSVTLASSSNKHNINPRLKDNFIQFRFIDNSDDPEFKLWSIRALAKNIGHAE